MKNSKSIFSLVEQIQKDRPGWRFSLLGGDVCFGYKTDKKGKHVRKNGSLVVDKKKKAAFGWRAEFFGHEDPSKDYGQRHASAGNYLHMNDAIIMACAQARKAIKDENKTGSEPETK
jgi:hypothetical protein